MDRIIINYLEGTATESEMQSLLDWIKEEENKKYFLEYRDIWIASGNTFSGNQYEEAFHVFEKNVLTYEKKRQRRALFIRFARYAASVAIFVLCSGMAYYFGLLSSSNKSASPDVVMNHIVIRQNKNSITLPDGTVAWLNNNSTLTYPDEFSSKERSVKLEGEAFFEVKADVNQPFYVETGKMKVKVTGTQFNVRNYADKDDFEVVLVSGRVEVAFNNNNDYIPLSPEHKLTYDKQTNTYSKDIVDPSDYILWKNDRLVMSNEELGVIFRKLERWYNIKIRHQGKLPLTSRYSITITDEPKEEILRLLSRLTPMEYKIANDTVIIIKK